jgi:hypothetical protein
MIRIRAFRATDDEETCEKFLAGHTAVLTNIGVQKVTSLKAGWISNPAAFVLIIESTEDGRVIGGARVEVAGGTEPLPIISATEYLDTRVHEYVAEAQPYGTGEVCGLWNSREAAALGIGGVFLIRAGIALAQQIRLRSLFALCAPYTVQMAVDMGYHILEGLGNNGTFYYPKLDLVATALFLPDVDTLSKADEETRSHINYLRTHPIGVRNEIIKKREVIIDYQLAIPNLGDWHKLNIFNKSWL